MANMRERASVSAKFESCLVRVSGVDCVISVIDCLCVILRARACISVVCGCAGTPKAWAGDEGAAATPTSRSGRRIKKKFASSDEFDTGM